MRFINAKNKKELENLTSIVKGFCVFPNDQEKTSLEQLYKKAIGTENHNFLFPMHTLLSQKQEKREAHFTEAIKKINLDYLWEKKLLEERLDSLYEDKLDGEISKDFYERKAKEYSVRIKDLDNKISKMTKASLDYYDFGSKILELANKTSFLYEKANPE